MTVRACLEIALVLVAALAVSAVDLHRPWNAETLDRLLQPSSRINQIDTGASVPHSLVDVKKYVLSNRDSKVTRLDTWGSKGMTWFDRCFDSGRCEQGVLLQDRVLLEWNATVTPIRQQKMVSDVSVMSFNIRMGTANDGDNSWPLRNHLVFDLINSYSADFVGLQEALNFQLLEILDNAPDYSYIGVGRDDGDTRGEYSAILYKSNRYVVVESGTYVFSFYSYRLTNNPSFWFCDTPTVPGCTSYGNSIPRISTWGRFVDRETNDNFYLYNCHLDHESVASRELSVQQMLDDIAVRVPSGTPVFLSGDFNTGENTNPILNLKNNGFVDTFRVIYPNATNVGTFNGFTGATAGLIFFFLFPLSRIGQLKLITRRQDRLCLFVSHRYRRQPGLYHHR